MSLRDLANGVIDFFEASVPWIQAGLSWVRSIADSVSGSLPDLTSAESSILPGWLSGWPGYLAAFTSGMVATFGIQKLIRRRESTPRDVNLHSNLPGADHSEQLGRMEGTLDQLKNRLEEFLPATRELNDREKLHAVYTQVNFLGSLAKQSSQTVDSMFALLSQEDQRRAEELTLRRQEWGRDQPEGTSEGRSDGADSSTTSPTLIK